MPNPSPEPVSEASQDQRRAPRERLLLMARCQWPGLPDAVRIKVRNLSASGLMAEAALAPYRGQPINVELRNIGWVEGTVAWVQGARFGVGFAEPIDPKAARGAPMPIEPLRSEEPDLVVRRPLAVRLTETPIDPRRARLI